MGVPQVAIVGRPNVGKSSLFNWLAGRRLAIVDDTPGVTRDRLTYLMREEDRFFELVDTGGLGFDDPDKLTAHIEEQIQAAIDSASVILLVVDTRTGLTPLDHEVARRLRYVDVPVLVVANKTDTARMEPEADEFHTLGRRVIKVSARENRCREALMRAILERLPAEADDESASGGPPEPTMKVAIVGRQNTGKSTLVNTLAQAPRVIVSEVPGTTRDSVDVRFEMDGQAFLAIDTPGLKRRTGAATDLDFYSLHRAQRSIRRADVVLLFFDAGQPITKVDKQLCTYIADEYKPCIFVVNKWDLYVDAVPTEKWVRYLHESFRTMHYVPIAFITGQSGKNVKAMLNHAQALFKQTRSRVSTGQLNRLLRSAVERNEPPMHRGARPKIYYGTQVGAEPPTIVLFCSDPHGLDRPYQRYLLNVFRDELPFSEVPIKLYLRQRESQPEGAATGSS
jgi:GTP-binding protein